MNHYYANGSPIFEGPPHKNILSPYPYGTIGWLESFLLGKGIKIEYKTNKETKQPDMYCTSPKGNTRCYPWRNEG